MIASPPASERVDLLRVYRRRCVRRWRYRAGHGADEQYLSLGWLPDGRWWVSYTRERLGWIFSGARPAPTPGPRRRNAPRL